MKKDLLTLLDLSPVELLQLIKRADYFKRNRKRTFTPLKGQVLGLIFEKESTRTRISFELAVRKLGGSSIYMSQNSSQLSRGESYADTARVLSRYLDVLVLRTYKQQSLEELASFSTIPVINGLTDSTHPCQVLADLLTIYQEGFDLKKVRVCYVGDGNNMAHTWIEAAMLLGFPLKLACPKGFEPHPEFMDQISKYSSIEFSHDPLKAVSKAQVVNTDTWFSMGQKVSDVKRKKFKAFQVNSTLLENADKDAIVLHCLPAHRGEEITDEVLDGPSSRVFDEAENRLYVQMAVLEALTKG